MMGAINGHYSLLVGGGGGIADPYFTDVVSLLHGEGLENQTVFTDETGKIWQRANTATTTQLQYKFGAASIRLSGNGTKIFCAHNDFTIGASDDFTIEMWMLPEADGVLRNIFAFGSGFDSGPSLYAYKTAAQQIYVSFGAASFMSSITIPAGAWHHIAIARAAGTMRLFVNGQIAGSVASNGATSASPTLHLGGMFAALPRPGMYMDEFRFTNGVARYTVDFSVPTAAFPNP